MTNLLRICLLFGLMPFTVSAAELALDKTRFLMRILQLTLPTPLMGKTIKCLRLAKPVLMDGFICLMNSLISKT